MMMIVSTKKTSSIIMASIMDHFNKNNYDNINFNDDHNKNQCSFKFKDKIINNKKKRKIKLINIKTGSLNHSYFKLNYNSLSSLTSSPSSSILLTLIYCFVLISLFFCFTINVVDANPTSSITVSSDPISLESTLQDGANDVGSTTSVSDIRKLLEDYIQYLASLPDINSNGNHNNHHQNNNKQSRDVISTSESNDQFVHPPTTTSITYSTFVPINNPQIQSLADVFDTQQSSQMERTTTIEAITGGSVEELNNGKKEDENRETLQSFTIPIEESQQNAGGMITLNLNNEKLNSFIENVIDNMKTDVDPTTTTTTTTAPSITTSSTQMSPSSPSLSSSFEESVTAFNESDIVSTVNDNNNNDEDNTNNHSDSTSTIINADNGSDEKIPQDNFNLTTVIVDGDNNNNNDKAEPDVGDDQLTPTTTTTAIRNISANVVDYLNEALASERAESSTFATTVKFPDNGVPKETFEIPSVEVEEEEEDVDDDSIALNDNHSNNNIVDNSLTKSSINSNNDNDESPNSSDELPSTVSIEQSNSLLNNETNINNNDNNQSDSELSLEDRLREMTNEQLLEQLKRTKELLSIQIERLKLLEKNVYRGKEKTIQSAISESTTISNPSPSPSTESPTFVMIKPKSLNKIRNFVRESQQEPNELMINEKDTSTISIPIDTTSTTTTTTAKPPEYIPTIIASPSPLSYPRIVITYGTATDNNKNDHFKGTTVTSIPTTTTTAVPPTTLKNEPLFENLDKQIYSRNVPHLSSTVSSGEMKYDPISTINYEPNVISPPTISLETEKNHPTTTATNAVTPGTIMNFNEGNDYNNSASVANYKDTIEKLTTSKVNFVNDENINVPTENNFLSNNDGHIFKSNSIDNSILNDSVTTSTTIPIDFNGNESDNKNESNNNSIETMILTHVPKITIIHKIMKPFRMVRNGEDNDDDDNDGNNGTQSNKSIGNNQNDTDDHDQVSSGFVRLNKENYGGDELLYKEALRRHQDLIRSTMSSMSLYPAAFKRYKIQKNNKVNSVGEIYLLPNFVGVVKPSTVNNNTNDNSSDIKNPISNDIGSNTSMIIKIDDNDSILNNLNAKSPENNNNDNDKAKNGDGTDFPISFINYNKNNDDDNATTTTHNHNNDGIGSNNDYYDNNNNNKLIDSASISKNNNSGNGVEEGEEGEEEAAVIDGEDDVLMKNINNINNNINKFNNKNGNNNNDNDRFNNNNNNNNKNNSKIDEKRKKLRSKLLQNYHTILAFNRNPENILKLYRPRFKNRKRFRKVRLPVGYLKINNINNKENHPNSIPNFAASTNNNNTLTINNSTMIPDDQLTITTTPTTTTTMTTPITTTTSIPEASFEINPIETTKASIDLSRQPLARSLTNQTEEDHVIIKDPIGINQSPLNNSTKTIVSDTLVDIYRNYSNFKIFCTYDAHRSIISSTPGEDEGRFFDMNTLEQNAPILKHCTHLIYAFANIDLNGDLYAGGMSPIHQDSTVRNNNKELIRANLSRLQQIKKQLPHLRVLVAVGGWDTPPQLFSLMVASTKLRERLSSNIHKFILEHDFDGTIIAWFYPVYGMKSSLDSRSTRATGQSLFQLDDKQNLIKFVRSLKSRFDSTASIGHRKLELGLMVPPFQEFIDRGYDARKLAQSVDHFILMTYDYYGSWENQVHHFAPLYAKNNSLDERNAKFNINYTVNYWINEKGAPRNHTSIGVAFYGRSFTLANQSDSRAGALSTGPGIAGPLTNRPGLLSFNELCELYLGNPNVRLNEDDYRITANLQLFDQWVGFDDELSLYLKTKYAIGNQLSGIFIWSINYDDYRNRCGWGSFPLLKAVNKAVEHCTVWKQCSPMVMKQPQSQPNDISNVTSSSSSPSL